MASGGAVEIGEAWFWWRLSHRRRAIVGLEALIGVIGEMTDDDDWVRVNGELWRARGASRGQRVRVRAVDGLTLEVEPL